jgi:hypothetical protein
MQVNCLNFSTVRQLTDLINERMPSEYARLRNQVRQSKRGLARHMESIEILRLAEQECAGLIIEAMRALRRRRREPVRTSPLWQFGSRTSLMCYGGEITGGNFGSSF